MKKIITTGCLLFFLQGARAQSWEHVGPKSDNQSIDNGFETSQLNNITVDPADPTHLFASGWFGGLWESTNRGEFVSSTSRGWYPVESTFIGSNGIAAMAFLSSTEIVVGDMHPIGRIPEDSYATHHNYSVGVWKYNFSTQTWSSTAALPNPLSQPLGIRSIAVYPTDNNIILVGTTMGLFRTGNGGVSWSNILPNTFIENIVFVPDGSGGYYCYVAGSNATGNYGQPKGTLLVMGSPNAGLSFPHDISSSFSTPSPYDVLSHSKICVGPTNASGDVQLFLYTLGSGANPDGFLYGTEYIHTFTKPYGSTTITSASNLTPTGAGSTSAGSGGCSLRMGFDYDPVNAGVWYGGTYLNFCKATGTFYNYVRSAFHSGAGSIHNDIHDIQIKYYSGQYEMYVAHDGGIVRTVINTFPPTSGVYFNILNDNLNVNIINGFSGTDDDENLYAVGGQDIINSDVYDAATGKNRYTESTWENDGALIDKFDKDKMFFDQNSYGPYYLTSEDGGATVTGAKGFFWPNSSASTLQPGLTDADGTNGFTTRLFFQDPYRPGRIFFAKENAGFAQYVYNPTTPSSSVFVTKIWVPQVDPTGGTFKLEGFNAPQAISFSPQSINSLHFIINGNSSSLSRPAVIKYIGNNIDDCWRDHNETFYTDGTGTHPQWATLTSTLWEDLLISPTDMYGIVMREIETSPWDMNVVYVLVTVPNHPDIKVLKYDGSAWTNYSTALPVDEIGFSMIMDRESDDALYLSTDKGVYYRNGPDGGWTPYTTGLPMMASRQMEINYKENTVRAGTYGRGIWKSALQCPSLTPLYISGCNNCFLPSAFFHEASYVQVIGSTFTSDKEIFRGVDYVLLTPGNTYTLLDPGTSTTKYYEAYIHGCSAPGNSYKLYSNATGEISTEEPEESEKENSIRVFPNPNNGSFTVAVPADEEKNIYVYDIMGKLVFQKMKVNDRVQTIDISNQPKGIYLVKVQTGNKIQTEKIIKE